MPELAMADAWRLVEAAPGFHHHAPDAFVLEEHPAFQHVHELHVGIVVVPFAVRRFAGSRAYHVRDDLALRRAPDAEIAILEVAAQAPALELSVACVRDVEAGHGAFILG
jgi:hypothetical protein